MKTIRHIAALLALAASTALQAQDNKSVAPSEVAIGATMPGSFFATPPGAGPFPAIILIGGSEGDDASARRMAPLFLEQGYAVLGLIYYSPRYFGAPAARFPQLPTAFASIPVERVEDARNWLVARPDVRSDSIEIYGVSKGAEFALLAGSLIDGFAAIAAIVPSDVVWEGWGPGTTTGESSSFAWRGNPLPFVPYIGMDEEIAKYGTKETPRLRIAQDRGRHANPDRAVTARIRVEAIDEPVLVAGGDADKTWNSGEMAQNIAERRAAAELPTVSLIYTDAGHGLSGDGTPREWYDEAELAAQKEIWPATLAFFARHLKGEAQPGG